MRARVCANTPLASACAVELVNRQADAFECAKIILEHNRSIDPAGFSAKYAEDLWQACMIHAGGKDGMLETVKLLLDSRVDPNVAVDISAVHGMNIPRLPLPMCVASPIASGQHPGCALAPHPLHPVLAGRVRVAHPSTSSRRCWKLGLTQHLLLQSFMI